MDRRIAASHLLGQLRRHGPNVAAPALLLALSAWYFLPHLLGTALFVGDSDRMSHYFTWLIHLNEGVRNGYLPTWSDSLFGGYNTAGVPYVYYNPLAFAGLLFNPELQNWVTGWTSALWLWFGGVAAYYLIRSTVPGRLYAFVGAALYQSSAVSVLKISQNEGTFSVVVLTPLILLCLQAARPGRFMSLTILCALAFTYLFSVSFLQESAYACLFFGLFVLYRLVVRREWSPLGVAIAAAIPSLIISLPRLVNVATEMRLSSRAASAGFQQTWQTLGTSNRFEILRWFDDRILGRYFQHALDLGNAINLHEGVLAYVSTYAVVIFLVGLAWHVVLARRGTVPWPESDIPFHGYFVLFCLSVAAAKFGYWVMYHLFLGVGFIHARITTVAIPSMCLLTAIFLHRLATTPAGRGSTNIPIWMMVLAVIGCAGLTVIVESVAMHWVDAPLRIVTGGKLRAVASEGAVYRVIISILICAVLLIAAFRFTARPVWRALLIQAIGILAVMQVAIYAKDQISGPYMLSDGLPFKNITRLLAHSEELRIPSATALKDLHATLEPQDFRTALMCDPARVGIYCTPYMAHTWRLREVGGYLNAIPLRVAALPWPPDHIGLRSITLVNLDSADWGLLALLNVQYAVEYHPGLLTNAVRDGGGQVRELQARDLTIHRNPYEAVPRVFFAREVVAKTGIGEVSAALFPGGKYDPVHSDVRNVSYVEGPSELQGNYESGQVSRVVFRDQFITIDLVPSDKSRFLVINERYHPGWRASAGMVETRVLPTNLFMRGIVIPPATTRVQLEFVPFSLSRRAVPFYLGGLVLLIVSLAIVAYFDRRGGVLPNAGAYVR